MIDVALQILNAFLTSGQYSARTHRLIYEIRSFWSKVIQVPAENGAGASPVVSVPGLTKDDWEKRKSHGEDVAICIEVYAESLHEFPSRTKIRVGVAMVSISHAIGRPHVNPVWVLVRVHNILHNKDEGELYVKYFTRFIPPFEATAISDDKSPDKSPYFSTSDKSDPALRCSSHLIDQLKNANLPVTTDNGLRLPNNFQQDSGEIKAGIRWAESTDSRKSSRIHHDLMTSPDFPFHIPAIETAENLLTAQCAQEKQEQSNPPKRVVYKYTSNNFPGSPPLFTYTPYIDKEWSSHSNTAASSPHRKGGLSKNSHLSSSIDDLLSALNTKSAESNHGDHEHVPTKNYGDSTYVVSKAVDCKSDDSKKRNAYSKSTVPPRNNDCQKLTSSKYANPPITDDSKNVEPKKVLKLQSSVPLSRRSEAPTKPRQKSAASPKSRFSQQPKRDSDRRVEQVPAKASNNMIDVRTSGSLSNRVVLSPQQDKIKANRVTDKPPAPQIPGLTIKEYKPAGNQVDNSNTPTVSAQAPKRRIAANFFSDPYFQ